MVFHDLPLPNFAAAFEFSDDFLRFYEDSSPLVEPGLDHSVNFLFPSPNDSPSDSDPPRYHARLDTPGSDPTRYHAGLDTPSPGSDPTRYHAGLDTPSSGLETPSEAVNQDNTSPEINSYDSGSGKPVHDPVEEPSRILSIQEERKRKRKISNRESAKRSRMRKRNELENLNEQVNRLKLENLDGTNRLQTLNQHLKMAWVDNNRLRIECLYLRTRLAEFERRFWSSQNPHVYMQ